ncbi:hypothetical protein HC352_02995 [Arcanobacterium buesumense]|uniref:Uncharacterized protein n=1 Tax=Arcanobacterium buesumense TaxID=2722751 RepID=A0A6H2EJ32_9ACTO|nr:hypothetical protein HC352_02995 [Arcanobacterium buesumense]
MDDVDVTGLNLKADIDRDSWMITLPADRFGISRDEEDIISSAYMGASMTCYKKYAPDQIWVDLPPLSGLNAMNPPVFSEFGVWRVGMAQQFGFDAPATARIPIAGRSDVRTPISREVVAKVYKDRGAIPTDVFEKAVASCEDDLDIQKFKNPYELVIAPWWDEINQARAKLFDDDAARQIYNDVASCFESEGLKMAEEGFGGVENFDFRRKKNNPYPAKEEIDIALKVAQCQEKFDATPKLAEILAEKQADIIKKYPNEFVSGRQKIDALVADAKQYIQEHPDVYVKTD